MIDLEARGVPGVFVATVEFIGGAETQARALGGNPAAVFVEHPIQDRTDAEMLAIADRAFEQVVAAMPGRKSLPIVNASVAIHHPTRPGGRQREELPADFQRVDVG